MKDDRSRVFRDAHQDVESTQGLRDTEQTRAPAYRLAFDDPEFLVRDELRPVRLQLELLKPELLQKEAGIESTVVLFGGARIPRPDDREKAASPRLGDLARFYDEARSFARIMTERSKQNGHRRDVIVTGGGPGVMEAGNRGAADAGGVSIGLNIVLPHEQAPNPYVTPDLCFNFHYFGIRKMHFLMRARAVAVFPGGFGTLDELFETLTLVQTGRMEQIPILLFGREFWEKIVDWEQLAEAALISRDDLTLFRFVETADEAVEAIDNWVGAGEKRADIPGR